MRTKSTTQVSRICTVQICTVQISFSIHRKSFRLSNRFSTDFCGDGVNPDQILASWLRWKSALHGHGNQPLKSSRALWSNERFDGWISYIMHHPKPDAVSLRSQRIRLGAQSSRVVQIRRVVRPTSAQSDTMRPFFKGCGLQQPTDPDLWVVSSQICGQKGFPHLPRNPHGPKLYPVFF